MEALWKHYENNRNRFKEENLEIKMCLSCHLLNENSNEITRKLNTFIS